MTAQSASKTSDNHRLELVGGKEEERDGVIHIDYGEYLIEILWIPIDQVFSWSVAGRYNIANGVASEYQQAIEAAESALLEEIAKFVKVKENQ